MSDAWDHSPMPEYDRSTGRHVRPTAPPSVDQAYWLYLLTLALNALSLLSLVSGDALDTLMRQAVVDSGGSLTEADASSLVSTSRVLVIVFGLGMLGVLVLFAVKMRNGRHWARVVLTVFSGLSVLSAISTVLGSGSDTAADLPWWSTPVSLLSFAATVGVLVLMWRPASNDYFTASKWHRG